jgi:putative copper export protein
MLVLGAQNLFFIKKKVGLEAPPESPSRRTGAARALIRNVIWEVGLGTVIILIVAVLGIERPIE